MTSACLVHFEFQNQFPSLTSQRLNEPFSLRSCKYFWIWETFTLSFFFFLFIISILFGYSYFFSLYFLIFLLFSISPYFLPTSSVKFTPYDHSAHKFIFSYLHSIVYPFCCVIYLISIQHGNIFLFLVKYAYHAYFN